MPRTDKDEAQIEMLLKRVNRAETILKLLLEYGRLDFTSRSTVEMALRDNNRETQKFIEQFPE